MSTIRKKLIEVALPLEAINAASAREKNLRQTHPATIHLWWARRPLVAARAVIFAQLVDDPSSWPELFPTEERQNEERARLFRIIEELVQWDNSGSPTVLGAARREIARCHARSSDSAKARLLLDGSPSVQAVEDYLATEVPPVHDPFCGGGSIPLEAQRLGIRAIASDLNPVAVLINKALIEIPRRFVGKAAVSGTPKAPKTSSGVAGLAADVRHYGTWLRNEAHARLKHLYPEVDLPADAGGGRGTVIAWLWARTVESPDPAFRGVHVPLVSNFLLSTKPGKERWIDPVVAADKRSYTFRIGHGPHPRLAETITRSGATCILSGSPIPFPRLREEARAGRFGRRLMAIAAEGDRTRIYLAPSADHERVAEQASASWIPDGEISHWPGRTNVVEYGMTRFSDLFTPRQLALLSTLADLVPEAGARATDDARHIWRDSDAREYGAAIATYLALMVSNLADLNNSLTRWKVDRECPVNLFSRQAIPMIWDFPETNPFSNSAGSINSALRNLCNRIEQFDWMTGASVTVRQADVIAALGTPEERIIATDPPYYDNIEYADISDFFYVWLRPALRQLYPDLFATMLVPKDSELVANPYRRGGKEAADRFFLTGMSKALAAMGRVASAMSPVTIFYAFKQSEEGQEGKSSTGWQSFLGALLDSGLTVDGTWPIRTELQSRMIGKETNALASSVVLASRLRERDAAVCTRGEFRRMLRNELPDALKKLQQGNIAPVDVAQASIGPGMAIFSRHKAVLEAEGAPMTVKAALQLINEVLDEYLASGEGDFDADTRFAITWYEQHGWEPGPFGDAETLAKARNVSVAGVVEAGICHSAAGKVRILKRVEMLPRDYDPLADTTPTVWEFTQHMIRYLEEEGEERAAWLLKRLGSRADATRELAYRLYNTCERKKWAEDARSYNGLILAWPELEKLAAKTADDAPPVAAPSKPGAKKSKKAKQSAKKAQQELFEGEDE